MNTFGRTPPALTWDPIVWKNLPSSPGDVLFLEELEVLGDRSLEMGAFTSIRCICAGVQRLQSRNTFFQSEEAANTFWALVHTKKLQPINALDIVLVGQELKRLGPSADPWGRVTWLMHLKELAGEYYDAIAPSAVECYLSSLAPWMHPGVHAQDFSDLHNAPVWLQRFTDILQVMHQPLKESRNAIQGFVEDLMNESSVSRTEILDTLLWLDIAKNNPVMHESMVQLLHLHALQPVSWDNGRDELIAQYSHAYRVLNPVTTAASRILSSLQLLVESARLQPDFPLLRRAFDHPDAEEFERVWRLMPLSLRKHHAEALLDNLCNSLSKNNSQRPLTKFSLLVRKENGSDIFVSTLFPDWDSPFWEYVCQAMKTLRPWSKECLRAIAIPNATLGAPLAKALDPDTELMSDMYGNNAWFNSWQESIC